MIDLHRHEMELQQRQPVESGQESGTQSDTEMTLQMALKEAQSTIAHQQNVIETLQRMN